MKQAILLRGPSGAGKSTIVKILKEGLPDIQHIDVDFFKSEISDTPSEARREAAYIKTLDALNMITKQKKDVIIDEQFREQFYQDVLNVLAQHGYQVLTVFLQTSLDALIQRDSKRKNQLGKERIETLYNRDQQILEEHDANDQDLIVDTTQFKPEEIVQTILSSLHPPSPQQ